jgi:hypothetical protein
LQFSWCSLHSNVVLWNKLGSDAEVTHSEVGLPGSFVGSSYAFELGKFGNGYVRKAKWNWLEFPGSILFNLAQRGTVAMWIVPKVSQPQPYNYGVFGLLGHPYSGQPQSMVIYWGDGVTGQGTFGGIITSVDLYTSIESQQFIAQIGVPFHVALAWDINGIDGSIDTIRVYRDGGLIGTTSGHWDTAKVPAAGFILGTGAESDENSYDKFVTDNLVVYDYAKTDFSDRFNENPVGHVFSTFTPRASVKLGKKSDDDSFKVSAKFGLGAKNNGIDPVAEDVTIKFGSFSTTIPAGKFQQQGLGIFTYKGTLNKVYLKVEIHEPKGSSGVTPAWFKPADYSFNLHAKGANLDSTQLPPEVQLTIGDDTGSAKLDVGKGKFGKGKDGEHWLSDDDD